MPDTDNHLLSKLEEKLFDKPFGSLTKRELEITLLEFLMDHGEEMSPEELAAKARLTMTKANSYLVDIALRKSPDTFNDEAMQVALLTVAKESEVKPQDGWLLFPVKNAALRIWLERKLSRLSRIRGQQLSSATLSVTNDTFLILLGLDALIGKTMTEDQEEALDADFKGQKWWKQAKAGAKEDGELNIWRLINKAKEPVELAKRIDQSINYTAESFSKIMEQLEPWLPALEGSPS